MAHRVVFETMIRWRGQEILLPGNGASPIDRRLHRELRVAREGAGPGPVRRSGTRRSDERVLHGRCGPAQALQVRRSSRGDRDVDRIGLFCPYQNHVPPSLRLGLPGECTAKGSPSSLGGRPGDRRLTVRPAGLDLPSRNRARAVRRDGFVRENWAPRGPLGVRSPPGLGCWLMAHDSHNDGVCSLPVTLVELG